VYSGRLVRPLLVRSTAFKTMRSPIDWATRLTAYCAKIESTDIVNKVNNNNPIYGTQFISFVELPKVKLEL